MVLAAVLTAHRSSLVSLLAVLGTLAITGLVGLYLYRRARCEIYPFGDKPAKAPFSFDKTNALIGTAVAGLSQGAGGTITVPYCGRWRNLSEGKRAVNRSHAKIRAVGEQANAVIKGWRLLRKLRCSPSRTTALVQAVLSLHLAASRRG